MHRLNKRGIKNNCNIKISGRKLKYKGCDFTATIKKARKYNAQLDFILTSKDSYRSGCIELKSRLITAENDHPLLLIQNTYMAQDNINNL